MKLLFLDIDGVMNTDYHLVRSERHAGLEFCPNAVRVIEEVVIETNCKIIISSSWRYGRTVDDLKDIFRPYSKIIANALIGKTGSYKENDDRQYEIKKYLESYRNIKNIEVESFVVIDDDIYDLYELCYNTVRTKDRNIRGLRYYMKKNIIIILNNERNWAWKILMIRSKIFSLFQKRRKK